MDGNRLLLLLTCVVLFAGCQHEKEDNQIRSTLSQFERRVIRFPDKMLCVEKGISEFRDISVLKPTFIVYVSSDECNECALAHLPEKSTLFKWAESSKAFQVYVIFSPLDKYVQTIFKRIKDNGYPFPVYIDVDGYMREKNAIPEDSRFHCFLLDELQHPVMVGNPLISPKVESLFWAVLRNI